jgi:ABC-type phosphate transport system permease subunit
MMPGIKVIDSPVSHGELSHVFLVDWNGEQGALYPQNFTVATRIMATLIVSALAFVVSASYSIESAVLSKQRFLWRERSCCLR